MAVTLFVICAGLGAGVFMALVPESLRAAIAVTVTVTVFGLYALRERRALRAMGDRLGVLGDGQHRLSRNLAALSAAHNQAAEDHRVQVTQLGQEVTRLQQLVREVASMHAVATNEVVSQWKRSMQMLHGQAAESERMRQAIGDALVQAEEDGAAAMRRFDQVDLRLGHAATQTELRRLHTEDLASKKQDFRQIEALIGLHALFQPRSLFPSSRNWAASPDIIHYMVDLVLSRRPSLIVELGGGLSTVWLAYAVERNGSGRIISVDHDPVFAGKTKKALFEHQLDGFVDLRVAPLTDVEIDGEIWPWYDPTAFNDVPTCDLLIVDGPPAAVRKHARYPALPLLQQRLAESAVVIMDDCVRQDEQEIVRRWRQLYPEWTVETIEHEKVSAILTR